MSLVKRTYSLPESVIHRWESEVPAGRRSGFLADLILRWLEERRRTALRRDIIEGCREMAALYLDVEREFHPLEEEVQHALDVPSQPRRRRPRSTRPRRRLRARWAAAGHRRVA